MAKIKNKKICVKERTLLYAALFMFDLSRFSLFLSLSDKHTQTTHKKQFKEHRLPLFHQVFTKLEILQKKKKKKKGVAFEVTTLKQ